MLGHSREHLQPVHPHQPGQWAYTSQSDNIGTPLASFVKALLWFGLCGGLLVICFLSFLFQVAWWGWARLPSVRCQIIVASGTRSLPVSLEFTYSVSFLSLTHQRFNPAFLLFSVTRPFLSTSSSTTRHPAPSQIWLPEPASCVTVSLHLNHTGSHRPALELTISSYQRNRFVIDKFNRSRPLAVWRQLLGASVLYRERHKLRSVVVAWRARKVQVREQLGGTFPQEAKRVTIVWPSVYIDLFLRFVSKVNLPKWCNISDVTDLY